MHQKTALVVIDIQKAYHSFPLLRASVDLSLLSITATLHLLRKQDQPVVFVQHSDNLFVKEGSPGFSLVDALEKRDSEPAVVKRHPNSFFHTNLADRLREKNVGLVVVCGLAASKCVIATMQGAKENGFEAAFLQHGVADIKENLEKVPYEVYPSVSTEVLKFFLSHKSSE